MWSQTTDGPGMQNWTSDISTRGVRRRVLPVVFNGWSADVCDPFLRSSGWPIQGPRAAAEGWVAVGGESTGGGSRRSAEPPKKMSG